jgi:leucyl-tRNA synthetase
VSSYIGGNEHAVLHLLYSRFVTMVLHDAGLVPFEEPFAKFRAHGLIVREGAKMSKSKGNVINPDDADRAVGRGHVPHLPHVPRPLRGGGDYRDAGISGVRRFLDRLYASVRDMTADGAPDPAVLRKLHQTIRRSATTCRGCRTTRRWRR